MNCLIIEDDLQSLEKVSGYITQREELTLIGACRSLNEAKSILRKIPVNLLFLDVELGGGDNGLNFYKSLKKKPHVIVMTSHPKYAVDSYAEHLAGFLAKPFGKKEFHKVIDYVLSLNKMHRITANIERFDTEAEYYIPIQEKNQPLTKVFFREIAYFEQDGINIGIHTIDQKCFLLKRKNLGEIEMAVPPQLFHRISKSIIVNITQVEHTILDMIVVGNRSFQVSTKWRKLNNNSK